MHPNGRVASSRKAPHHTAGSWRAWLYDNDDIVRSVSREVLGRASVSTEPESIASEEEHGQSSEPDYQPEMEVDEAGVSLSSSESEGEIRKQDAIASQCKRRSTYLPSDKRALAKSIAEVTLAKWKPCERAGNEYWRKFSVKVSTLSRIMGSCVNNERSQHNAHSPMAWRDWYRKNRNGVFGNIPPQVRRSTYQCL